MSEKSEHTEQAESTAPEGDVGAASDDRVETVSGTAQTIEARSVTVKQGSVNTIKADSVQMRQGGVGRVEANSVRAEQSGIGLVRAETVDVYDGGVFGAYGDTVHLEQSDVTFLAAKKVDGEARVLLDWRAALAFGAGLGLAFWLLRFFLDRD
jgi:hypothetical protein